jgi:hypothetical protein
MVSVDRSCARLKANAPPESSRTERTEPSFAGSNGLQGKLARFLGCSDENWRVLRELAGRATFHHGLRDSAQRILASWRRGIKTGIG